MSRTSLWLAICLSALTCAAPSEAGEVSGRVEGWSEDARYEVWRTTSLDLSRGDQPQARVLVTDPSGDFSLTWQDDGRPSWIFLQQQVQPVGGPAMDLFRPADLLPLDPATGKAISLHGVDPGLIWERSLLSTRPDVLHRTLLLLLLVLGAGLGVRLGMRSRAAPAGLRSAPLYELPQPRPADWQEKSTLAVILAAAAGLRIYGISDQSLDLLELSYLPGIGRPVLAAGAGGGLAGLTAMLQEFGALYCLDLVHPPLYHLLLGFITLAGDSEWLLRLPALLASLASTALIWQMFRPYSPAVALSAAALHALAAPAIYFGQDATPYALVGLVGLTSLSLLLRALRLGTTRAWGLWFTIIVVGFGCHYGIALVGLAELTGVALFAFLAEDRRRWAAALHRASGPALGFAPIPLLWAWLHFSTFPTVAQDTLLVADTYSAAPGLVSFVWDFFCVTAGLPADGPMLPALAAVALVTLGLLRSLSRPAPDGRTRTAGRAPGMLLWLLFLTFVLSVAFFYLSIQAQLGGRVFYGFRWLSWFHPLMLGLIALGAVAKLGPKVLRVALGLIWLSGFLPATLSQLQEPPRPDYEGAAQFIRQELADRDGLASLPAWFQRGNLTHYLKAGGVPSERHSRDGPGVWTIDGKRINLEAIHTSLPFESSAASGHVDRLWVADIRETMFGRAKFSASVAEQAIRWADEHMLPDGKWQLRGISLHRYRHKPGGEASLAPGGALLVSAERAVLTRHSYPLLDELPPTFTAADKLAGLPEGLGSTVRLHSPMAPSCVEWDWGDLRLDLDPEASHHWYLDLRIPLSSAVAPRVVKRTPAQLDARVEDGCLRITAVGQSCDQPPLQLLFLPPEESSPGQAPATP